jgi:hypothetical protein
MSGLQPTNILSERFRDAGNWISHNVHYLGLIALMAGLGALIAGLTWKSLQSPCVELSGETLTPFRANGLQLSGTLAVGGGIILLGLATVHYLGTRKLIRQAQMPSAHAQADLEAPARPVTDAALKWRALTTRGLIMFAALGLAYGITALAIYDGTHFRWFCPGNDPGMSPRVLFLVDQAPYTTINAVAIPLSIIGGLASLCGLFKGRRAQPAPTRNEEL